MSRKNSEREDEILNELDEEDILYVLAEIQNSSEDAKEKLLKDFKNLKVSNPVKYEVILNDIEKNKWNISLDALKFVEILFLTETVTKETPKSLPNLTKNISEDEDEVDDDEAFLFQQTLDFPDLGDVNPELDLSTIAFGNSENAIRAFQDA